MTPRRKWLLAVAALAVPAISISQQKSIARVGILSGRSREASIAVHARFLRGMRDLGYIEGRNVHYEWRYAGGRYQDLRRMADELVTLKVDVILAEGTSSIAPARRATSTIPIVMATSSDPVGSGFVASLARPGGNVTGLTSNAVEAIAKRLELLKVAVPGLSRVAALANRSPAGTTFLRQVESAAAQLNLRIVPLEAASSEEIERAFSSMAKEQAQALIVGTDAFLISRRHEVAQLAARGRLPAIYPTRDFFDAGGLLMYGVDIADMYRRAATYVDRVLKGAKPDDLPVQLPDKYELLVNLKTAKALGITMPQTLLMLADQVTR